MYEAYLCHVTGYLAIIRSRHSVGMLIVLLLTLSHGNLAVKNNENWLFYGKLQQPVSSYLRRIKESTLPFLYH